MTTEADVSCICDTVQDLLNYAYWLCSDTLTERKMRQQRANILSKFCAGASWSAEGFHSYKNTSTLKKYFTTCKQLLLYYFHVAHGNGQHFTPAAMQNVLGAVHNEDRPAVRTQSASCKWRSSAVPLAVHSFGHPFSVLRNYQTKGQQPPLCAHMDGVVADL